MLAVKTQFTHVAAPRPFEFTNEERCLLVEALNRAATRQESESRFNPRSAGPHDLKASRMRKLAARIAKGGVVTALLIAAALYQPTPASAGNRCCGTTPSGITRCWDC